MHIETERKFLVEGDAYKKEAVRAIPMVQGYLARGGGNTVRVRIGGEQAWLTIKGPSPDGVSRPEWEREIPVEDAKELLPLCLGSLIDKTRFLVPAGEGRFFEVDEFHGDNAGLVVAEIELSSEDEDYPRPRWLGKEVTGERKYRNAQLSVHPFKEW